MQVSYVTRIAKDLSLPPAGITAVIALLDDGGTIPFIARYRKEATGELDEVQISAIRDRVEQLRELDKRRESIIGSMEERQLLTDELRTAIEGAETLTALEDIYLPFRPKRRTRAMMAREKGLEPLALTILEQGEGDPATLATEFISEEKGVATPEDALAGARDIIAETVSEDGATRARMRDLFAKKGTITSRLAHKDKEEAGARFRDYFEWTEPVDKAPSHRVLAILRGENEEMLKVCVEPPRQDAQTLLHSQWVRGGSAASKQVALAVDDAYDRLLASAMETEIRSELKKRADEVAIKVFADNLRELLLSPPLGQKRVMAIDPGLRTGCKIVCLDAQGTLLHTDVVYLQRSDREAAAGGNIIRALADKFKIEAIAIGNGTGGRETEQFVKSLDLPASITVVMVNESGASIYSASEVAREEFPDQDITVRGSVSIGRRLMDPLAELVKIDPKSIGVGQYQHDVDQKALKRGLDDVVESCVNGVGVEVNTASRQLLTYVAGLGPQLAGNIVKHRTENGPFISRASLKKVPRLGAKAFEQAAGFLRIRDAKNPLDGSAVHPESYHVVEQMAKDLGCTVSDLMRDASLRAQVDLNKYVTDKVGLPTLTDIMQELSKPGRDPREQFEAFSFTQGVNTMDDLKPGMKLPGIVTNVTAFGAFVDVGVHQDGLVHVSQLADKFVKDPNEVVKVHQKVMVTVTEVDAARKRIALSMRSDAKPGEKSERTERREAPKRHEQNRTRQPKPQPRPLPAKNNWFSEALANAKKK